jgi:uncharacterized protein (TIGR02145 family)
MKKTVQNLLSLVVLTLLMSACAGGIGGGNSVKIGTLTWTTKNLNVTQFRNGDPILEVKTFDEWRKAILEKKPAFCDIDFKPENGEKLGKLYNVFVIEDARGLAPEGWHIPSYEEWKTLKMIPLEELKSTDGWGNAGDLSCNGNNKSGFNALPAGGIRTLLPGDVNYGRFKDQFEKTYGQGNDLVGFTNFWEVHDASRGDFRAAYFQCNQMGAGAGEPDEVGLSVRCVKDAK